MVSVKISIRVQFFDVDSMQIVWHGNYARYFEEARCALLEKLDYTYTQMAEAGHLWPIVEMSTKFIRPAKFGQRLDIVATLAEYENRIRIDYRIFDQLTGELMTKAQTTQLCVEMVSGELRLDAPADFIAKVRNIL